MNPPALHALTPKQAKRHARLLQGRAKALRLFTARYSHNPESQRAMLGGLHRLTTTFSEGRYDARTFPWEVLVDETLTQTMWSTVAAGYGMGTATKDASALRVMLDCSRRAGLLSHEQYRHARGFEVKGGQARPPAGRYLSTEDMVRIVTTCQAGRGGERTRTRDTALILVLAGSGARREELASVQMADVHLHEHRIWLGRTKGGRPRDAYLHPTAVEALRRWIEVRGHDPGGLFVPLSRTGRPLVYRGNLSAHQMWKVVRSRAAEAGLEGVTPHDMRRFLITHLLESVDLVLVAKVVGHTRPSTTARYDRRPKEAQRAAVAQLPLPALPLPQRPEWPARPGDDGPGAAQ